MHRNLVFMVSAGVLAQNLPGPAPLHNILVPHGPAPTLEPDPLQRRDLDSCNSAAEAITTSILTDLPTLGPSLNSFVLHSPNALLSESDACKDPVITEADPQLQSEWSSFATAYTSWRDSHLCDFKKLFDECVTIPSVSSMVFAPESFCTDVLTQLKGDDCNTGATADSTATTTSLILVQAGGAGQQAMATGAVFAGMVAYAVAGP